VILLGVDDRTSGPELMNKRNFDPVQKAIAWDYEWAFGQSINDHRAESRYYKGGRRSGNFGPFPVQSYASTRELRFPYMHWWLR